MQKIAVTIDYEYDWGGRVKTVYAIEKNIDKVLEIFEKNSAKATFFISGETANKTKNIIRKIYEHGHEIASHGYNHNLRYDLLTKEKLNFEIENSKKILEDLIGEAVYGFRTPQFRKNRYTEELLLKNGYLYDSSSVETNFLNRYKKNQFQFGKIKNFPVSSIYGKIPAGLKWINLLGKHIKKSSEVTVIYLHLFDLLSMKDIIKLYDSKKISKIVLLFYLARRRDLFKTLEDISISSKPLKQFLD